MPLFIVRHAKAGSRSRWTEEDTSRPLTRDGISQSETIALRLAPLNPSVLISSPYLRCTQTLEPLSQHCGLDIDIDHRLSEGSPLEIGFAVLEDAPDNAVLCSHGDVIEDMVNALLRRGTDVDSTMRSPRKGSIITVNHVNKLFTSATYWD